MYNAFGYLLLLFLTRSSILQKIKDFRFGPSDTKECRMVHNVLNNAIWFISTARNIIVVVFCAVLTYLFEAHGTASPFMLTGTYFGCQPRT